MKQEKQAACIICKWKSPCFNLELKKDKHCFDEPYFKDFIADINESDQPRYGLIERNDEIMFLCYLPDKSLVKDKIIYLLLFGQWWHQLELEGVGYKEIS